MMMFRAKRIRVAVPFLLMAVTVMFLYHQGMSPSPSSLITSHFHTNLKLTFETWDFQMGCAKFVEKHTNFLPTKSNCSSHALQNSNIGDGGVCPETGLKRKHVNVLVKARKWIPDNLGNLYSCRCGISCLWTKSDVLADNPDALFYENITPPRKRQKGEPLRAYIDLEPGRKPTGFEDIFVGYHAKDDIQITYAGAMFHNSRNYHVSPYKLKDVLVYWSSSRCLSKRNKIAKEFFSLVPHHSFGKCLNNMNGLNVALDLYPECSNGRRSAPQWWDHLHCAMSHYKFVLAIENTITESYVTEKLFYALDSGSVPIYFGAPNVWDFVPPNSIIDASKFSSIEELASYVKKVADDPVAYAEFHAWRRCGVLGNYAKTRSLSIDTLPCRLCEFVSRKGGRNAEA